MLDAIVWILHGHVFATAMTGNTVLLGVALLTHNNWQALRHLLPLLSFSIGVLGGWSILRRVREPVCVHHIALLVQIVALALAGAAPPGFPSGLMVVIVAATASVQIATFQRVDTVPYNSTFITGDIRTLLEALYDSFRPEARDRARQQLRALGPVCLGFFAGVLLGGFLAPRTGNHSLWAVCGVLLAARLLLG